MICEWCKGPLPEGSRRDRKTCSKKCRQAKQRFEKHIRRAGPTDRPMHFAYADPPYPGLSRRYYKGHEDFGGEVDHRELVSRLTARGDTTVGRSRRRRPRSATSGCSARRRRGCACG